jgi:hypothetical protein
MLSYSGDSSAAAGTPSVWNSLTTAQAPQQQQSASASRAEAAAAGLVPGSPEQPGQAGATELLQSSDAAAQPESGNALSPGEAAAMAANGLGPNPPAGSRAGAEASSSTITSDGSANAGAPSVWDSLTSGVTAQQRSSQSAADSRAEAVAAGLAPTSGQPGQPAAAGQLQSGYASFELSPKQAAAAAGLVPGVPAGSVAGSEAELPSQPSYDPNSPGAAAAERAVYSSAGSPAGTVSNISASQPVPRYPFQSGSAPAPISSSESAQSSREAAAAADLVPGVPGGLPPNQTTVQQQCKSEKCLGTMQLSFSACSSCCLVRTKNYMSDSRVLRFSENFTPW